MRRAGKASALLPSPFREIPPHLGFLLTCLTINFTFTLHLKVVPLVSHHDLSHSLLYDASKDSMYYPTSSLQGDLWIQSNISDCRKTSHAMLLSLNEVSQLILVAQISVMASIKAPAGQFTLLYFASSTSFTRKEHDFFPAPLPIAKLFDMLDSKYPGIKSKVLESSAVTINLDYVDVEEELGKGDAGLVIKEADEVAIIPPVSSG
jgi:molybdopterin converting factor small subunit